MDGPFPDSALTAHEQGLRRLARSLVRDEHEADDAVQQAYLNALAHRGPAPQRETAWFRGVLRNAARNLGRGRARQRRRERAAARTEAVGSTLDAVVKLEERTTLLRAVMALDPLYREVIVLRFFDGLPPRRIAARLGCPVATVKSRLQRALARLRVALDATHGGDRRRWKAALAPLLGGYAMSSGFRSTLLALCVLLLAGGAVVVLTQLPRRFAEEKDGVGAPDRARAETGPRLHGHEGPSAPVAADAPPPPSGSTLDTNGLRVYPAVRPSAALEGRVVDAARLPVAGAEVVATAVPAPQMIEMPIGDDRQVVRRTRSDERGRFAFADLPAGPYAVRATHGDRSMDVVYAVALEDGFPVTLRLARRADDRVLRVRVVDAGGEPVPGVAVEVTGDTSDVALTGRSEAWTGTTDEEGIVAWREVELQDGIVFARAPDGRQGLLTSWTRDETLAQRSGGALEVVLAAVGALEGDVTAEDGASLEGAHVEAHARTSTGAYYTSHERVWEAPVIEGRYRFDALPVGQFCVVARGGGIRTVVEWIQDGRFPTAPQATVEAGATARLDLTVADGAVIEGVVTAGGAAVRGARVRATRDPRTSNVPDGVNLLGANVRRYDYPGTRPADHPLTHRWATTGADGRYRLDGLEPGPYRIDVFAEGLSHVQRLGVEARVEEPTPLDVTLVPAGVLQGVVPERAYVGVRPVDSRTFAAIAILGPAHVFTFAGLPPGEYEVGSPYWNRETTVFGRARVEAGRTTWIDLRDSGRNAARGRVLAGGRPLPDAVVQFRWRRARTDGTGRFEVRWEDADSVSGAAFEVHRDLPGGGQQTWKVHRDVPPTGESEVGDLVVGEHVLTLRVVDGEGVPLVVWLDVSAGAEGGAVKGSGGGGPIMQARGRTGEDGILRLEGCPANDRYVAKAEADGLPFQTTFSVPAPAPVLVQVPETGALTVEVLDASGDARAEANVAATSWTGAGPAPVDEEAWASARPGEATTVYGTTGQDGRARLPRVVAGTVRVVAWWKTRSTGLAPSTYAHGRVDLGPGEERAVRVRAEDTR